MLTLKKAENKKCCRRKSVKNYPASDWQGRYEEIHYDKVAGTSKHDKYMKDFV